MKTTLIFFFLLLCENVSAQVVYTYQNPLDDKAFKMVLVAIRNKEAQEKDLDLFYASSMVLKDLEGKGITVYHGDKLSTVLIIRYKLLLLEGGEKEPYGATLRNAIVMINRRMTKMVKPQKVFEDDIQSCLLEINKMDKDMSRTSLKSEPSEFSLPIARLQTAIAKVKLTFIVDDPQLALDTEDIRLLRQMASVAEDGGYKNAAKAMLLTAAAVSGKLEVVKRPTLAK